MSAAFLMPFPPTARGIKFTVQGHTEVSCSYFMQYALKVYKLIQFGPPSLTAL